MIPISFHPAEAQGGNADEPPRNPQTEAGLKSSAKRRAKKERIRAALAALLAARPPKVCIA